VQCPFLCPLLALFTRHFLQAKDCFEEGKCHVQSGRHADAATSFSMAMSHGHSLAVAHLSWLLLFGGVGLAKDYKRAIALARSGQHCHHCQGCLSCCYAEGWGVPKNSRRGLLLAKKSAGSGSVFGLYMMGWFHENGEGTTLANPPLALAFYKQAASLGLAAAQNNAGFM